MRVPTLASRPVPQVDTSDEVWRATFPGLGELTVSVDGTVVTDPEPVLVPDPPQPDQWWDDVDESGCFPAHWESTDRRAAALRWGWGEPLAQVRRGHRLTHAATMVDPDGRALALRGSDHEIAIVAVGLLRAGWLLLADEPTVMQWQDDELIALPSQRPLVVAISLLKKTFPDGLPDGWQGSPTRGSSNSVTLDVPRWTEPAPIAALVSAEASRGSEPTYWEAVRGHQKFMLAAGLFISYGPLAATDNDGTISEKARIAQLPMSITRNRGGGSSPGLPDFFDWWAGLC